MYIESEIVELKRDYTKEIIKEMIAFLNTKGGKAYPNYDINETMNGDEKLILDYMLEHGEINLYALLSIRY